MDFIFLISKIYGEGGVPSFAQYTNVCPSSLVHFYIVCILQFGQVVWTLWYVFVPCLASVLPQLLLVHVGGVQDPAGTTVVLILHGNSDIGAHVGRIICYFICLRHLFVHACASCFELPCNRSNKIKSQSSFFIIFIIIVHIIFIITNNLLSSTLKSVIIWDLLLENSLLLS